MSKIEVDEATELPDMSNDGKAGRPPIYPFRECTEVGMSFFIPDKQPHELAGCLSYWNKTLAPIRFRAKDDTKKIRDEELGVTNTVLGSRVWRIK